MKPLLGFFLAVLFAGCTSSGQRHVNPALALSVTHESKAPRNSIPVIHVFVALCDNVNQGIVPVPASLGNGEDAASNLYWGAGFGVKTFFLKSKAWQLVHADAPSGKSPSVVLDRVIFQHRDSGAFLVAEAYRGDHIRQATEDFLAAAAGTPGETVKINTGGKSVILNVGGSAALIAYVGHDGLMDFQLNAVPKQRDSELREAIILACASKSYFAAPLKTTGVKPLLWTTNLMAPEAYVLSAAIDGWLRRETDEQIRLRAATAYHQYQKCGLEGAKRLFATGW